MYSHGASYGYGYPPHASYPQHMPPPGYDGHQQQDWYQSQWQGPHQGQQNPQHGFDPNQAWAPHGYPGAYAAPGYPYPPAAYGHPHAYPPHAYPPHMANPMAAKQHQDRQPIHHDIAKAYKTPTSSQAHTVTESDSADSAQKTRDGVVTSMKYLCTFKVGIPNAGTFRIGQRLIGPGGHNMKLISHHCAGTKVRLRGEGFQGTDKTLPLQINVSSTSRETYVFAKHMLSEMLTNIYQQYGAESGRRVNVRLSEHPLNPDIDMDWEDDFLKGDPKFREPLSFVTHLLMPGEPVPAIPAASTPFTFMPKLVQPNEAATAPIIKSFSEDDAKKTRPGSGDDAPASGASTTDPEACSGSASQ